MVTTISSNCQRRKFGRQCKDESLENIGNGQSQRGDFWPWLTAEMYNVVWNVLIRSFGKPQMVVERICSFPPMKLYDGAAFIKFARIVPSRENVLTQVNYVGYLNLEGVLGSATRTLTMDMKPKWFTHVKQMNLYQPGLAVFSEWLNDIAEVHDELQTRMLIARSRATRKRPKAPRLQHQQQT